MKSISFPFNNVNFELLLLHVANYSLEFKDLLVMTLEARIHGAGYMLAFGAIFVLCGCMTLVYTPFFFSSF